MAFLLGAAGLLASTVRLDVDLRVGVVEVDVVVIVGARLGPLVEQGDGQALVEERGLLEPRPDGLEVEVDAVEDGGVGPERDRGAGLLRVVQRLVLREGSAGDALVEGHPEHVAHLADLDVEPGRERVDDRGADAVQTTGHLVAPPPNFPPACSCGEHQLHGGHVLAVALAGGDAAAVVDDGDAPVGADGHVDAVSVAGQRLVDGVVDDLPDQVVQAALTGRPDVHARALADRFQSLEDLDRRRRRRPGSRTGRSPVRSGPAERCRLGWPWSRRRRTRCSFVHRRP